MKSIKIPQLFLLCIGYAYLIIAELQVLEPSGDSEGRLKTFSTPTSDIFYFPQEFFEFNGPLILLPLTNDCSIDIKKLQTNLAQTNYDPSSYESFEKTMVLVFWKQPYETGCGTLSDLLIQIPEIQSTLRNHRLPTIGVTLIVTLQESIFSLNGHDKDAGYISDHFNGIPSALISSSSGQKLNSTLQNHPILYARISQDLGSWNSVVFSKWFHSIHHISMIIFLIILFFALINIGDYICRKGFQVTPFHSLSFSVILFTLVGAFFPLEQASNATSAILQFIAWITMNTALCVTNMIWIKFVCSIAFTTHLSFLAYYLYLPILALPLWYTFNILGSMYNPHLLLIAQIARVILFSVYLIQGVVLIFFTVIFKKRNAHNRGISRKVSTQLYKIWTLNIATFVIYFLFSVSLFLGVFIFRPETPPSPTIIATILILYKFAALLLSFFTLWSAQLSDAVDRTKLYASLHLTQTDSTIDPNRMGSYQ